MNPETRAARDRIAAYLKQRGPDRDNVISTAGPRSIRYAKPRLRADDLHTVLAALDAQPAFVAVTDAVLTEEQAEDLKRRIRLAAQHDGTPSVLGEPQRVPCADCGNLIQYIDHPGWSTGWMHIFEAADHQARPTAPETSDLSDPEDTP